MTRHTFVIFASILISVMLMWFALRGLDVELIGAQIANADKKLLVVSFLIGILPLVTRAIRWRGLINNQMSIENAFYMFSITMLLNQLPMRLGEVARSFLARREGVLVATAATSIVVERLLDLVFVLVLLGVSLTQVNDIPHEVSIAAGVLSILVVIGFAALLVFARYQQIAHRILDVTLNRLPFMKRLPLTDLLDQILDGLQPLIQWRKLLHAVVWTIISWTTSLIMVYFIQISVNGTPKDSFMLTSLFVSLASLAIAIPLSVASVGPLENAAIAAGSLLGYSQTISLSMGLLFHGVSIVTYIVYGAVGMIRMGVSLGNIIRTKRVVSHEETKVLG